MTIQLSDTVRNAMLDAIEVAIGASAILKIRSGAQPANCAAADSGTVLATVNLPADWMNPASGGTKTKSGTWQDLSADNNGIAGHYRIYDSGGVNCHKQGSVGIGSGDLQVDNTNFATGQPFTVTAMTWTAPNP